MCKLFWMSYSIGWTTFLFDCYEDDDDDDYDNYDDDDDDIDN